MWKGGWASSVHSLPCSWTCCSQGGWYSSIFCNLLRKTPLIINLRLLNLEFLNQYAETAFKTRRGKSYFVGATVFFIPLCIFVHGCEISKVGTEDYDYTVRIRERKQFLVEPSSISEFILAFDWANKCVFNEEFKNILVLCFSWEAKAVVLFTLKSCRAVLHFNDAIWAATTRALLVFLWKTYIKWVQSGH